jgi:hypothetical protein
MKLGTNDIGNVYLGTNAVQKVYLGTNEVWSSFTGLLDTYTGAAAAYSLRLLRTAYTGSAIEVRRTNNDVADIGFTSTGELDTAALLAFTGTGALDNGFVTKWYDQSGNAINATQTTAANQPQIVSSGSVILENGKPAVEFDGIDDFLNLNTTMANNFANSTNKTLISIYKHDAIVGARSRPLFLGLNTTTRVSLFADTLNLFKGSFNSFPNTVDITFNVNQQFLTFGEDIGGTQTFYLNSTTSGTNNLGGTNNDINVAEISNVRNSQNFLGNLQEMLLYNSNQSSNRSGIEDNINDFYSIY